jgi:hypothetical protein
MVRTNGYFVIRELYKSGGTKLYAAVVATLAAMAVSLILTPGVAHAYQVHISITGGGQVTETTPANLVGSGCVTSANNPTGTVGKDCYAGTLNGDYGIGWDVDYLATPKPGYKFVQWQSDGNPNPVICDRSTPAATTSTYTGTACKFRTFNNLQTRAVFEDTTDPPIPSITGMSPQSGYTSGAITFFFSTSSDPTLKGFQCSIDSQSSWQSCSSGQSFTASEGNHTLYVRSIDWSGNTSIPTASQMWTVDKTAPNTTLDPGVGPQPGSTVESTDAVFQFSSSEPTNATFECNLTGPGLTSTSFTPCNTSPNTSTTKSYTNLKDGSYTFKVRAKDQAGNVDDTPDQRQWTVRNAPTVVESSLIPTKLQRGVSRNTNVSATFSEEMATISLKEPDNTSKTFKLQQYNKKKKTWKTIPATISLSNTNKTATLDPYGATEGTTDTLLAANKKFRAIITTGAKDLEGNPMTKQFVWTFTTGAS